MVKSQHEKSAAHAAFPGRRACFSKQSAFFPGHELQPILGRIQRAPNTPSQPAALLRKPFFSQRGAFFSAPGIQPKLTVGQPGGHFEQEADRGSRIRCWQRRQSPAQQSPASSALATQRRQTPAVRHRASSACFAVPAGRWIWHCE